MNNVLRSQISELVTSYGGTEKWLRKENLVADRKANKVKARRYNAPNVED
jgi:hypothetical protein